MKKNITKIECQLIKDDTSPFQYQEYKHSKSTIKTSTDLNFNDSDHTCINSNFIPNFDGQTNLKNPIKYKINHKTQN